MRSKDEGILYDFERDGALQVGETILIYEDGTREKVNTTRLKTKTKEKSDVANQAGRRPITQRSRVSARIKRTKGNTRQSSSTKRLSVLSPDNKRQGIPSK